METNEGTSNVFRVVNSEDEPGSGVSNRLDTLGEMLWKSDQHAVTVVQPSRLRTSAVTSDWTGTRRLALVAQCYVAGAGC